MTRVHAHRRRRDLGMTLVELIIAMAVLGLMMTLAWTTINSAGNARADYEDFEDRNAEVRVAMARMVHDLESAYLSHNENEALDNRRTMLKGKSDEITFSTFSHTPMWSDANESDQTIVVYYIDQDRRDKGTRSLFRRELRRPSNERLESEPAEIDVLLRGLESLELEYWDWNDKDWQASWDTTKQDSEKDRLPIRVRITVEYKSSRGDKVKLSTQARMLLQEALRY